MSFTVSFSSTGGAFAPAYSEECTSFALPFNSDITVSGGTPLYENYTGEYDVTPLITAQTLYTRDKHMVDDVRIDMIPTREINNAAGGVTFIVGG